MTFLIDTNVISEVRKGDNCDFAVASWWGSVAEHEVWLSSLVLGEVRKGVELLRHRDALRAEVLERWLNGLILGFRGRVLPVDTAIAEEWGRMNAIRVVPVIDGLMAATAKVYRLTFVTRNIVDVAGLNVDVMNPFAT